MGILLLMLLAAAAAAGGSKSGSSTSSTKKPDPKLIEPPIEPVVSPDPVSNVPEKIKNTIPFGFTDLGIDPGTVLKLNSVDQLATDWPGLRSLPDAWQRGALNLVSTIHYDVAMGKFPLSTPTSVKPESLYSFAMELDDAKGGSEFGFGTNVSLALKELLTTARKVESVRGYNAANRWGWEGSY